MNEHDYSSGARSSSDFIDSSAEIVYWVYGLVLLAVITIVAAVIYYFECNCNHKLKIEMGKRFNLRRSNR